MSGLGQLIRRLVMKTSVPPVDLRAGECWWCGGPADSREHRYKRSDLKREHGKGGYSGDAVLSRISYVRSVARSSKSDTLKFPSSMCQPCNNTRSQPFDDAYDAPSSICGPTRGPS